MLTARQGRVDASLLDLPRSPQHVSLISAAAPHSRGRGRSGGSSSSASAAAHAAAGALAAAEAQEAVRLPELQQGRPVAVPGAASGAHRSCGWLFHSDDVFRREQLLQLLEQLVAAVLRVKGVFRWGALLAAGASWLRRRGWRSSCRACRGGCQRLRRLPPPAGWAASG